VPSPGHQAQQQLTSVAQGTERDATNVEVEVRVLAGVLQEHAPPDGATDARETANPSASGAEDTAFDSRASDAGGQEQQRNPMPVGPDRHGHRTLNPETEVRILDGQHGPRGGTEDARGSDPRAHTGMQVQLLPGARMILEGWAPGCYPVVRDRRSRRAFDPRALRAHEVEHGGLCSALMRRRIRFDS
jgi:hypothetical protein